jgi:hypothetical protein
VVIRWYSLKRANVTAQSMSTRRSLLRHRDVLAERGRSSLEYYCIQMHPIEITSADALVRHAGPMRCSCTFAMM